MVAHTCNSSTWELEARAWGVQGGRLEYIRPYLKKLAGRIYWNRRERMPVEPMPSFKKPVIERKGRWQSSHAGELTSSKWLTSDLRLYISRIECTLLGCVKARVDLQCHTRKGRSWSVRRQRQQLYEFQANYSYRVRPSLKNKTKGKKS